MKNICIVGAKPDTWEGCKKLDRRSWQIWRYSRSMYDKDPQADVWFELHHERNYKRFENGKPGYLEFLKNHKKLFSYENFPFAELIDEFGPWFFGHGQAPWLLAYAITQEPKKIQLYGIEPNITRYGVQRLEVQHFISIAQMRGIEVSSPEDPGLLEYSPLYCIEQDWGGQKTMLETLKARGVDVDKVSHIQKEFASEQPANELLARVMEREQARKLKYG